MAAGIGERHPLAVHDVVAEGAASLLDLGLLSHAGPDVGVHHVCAPHGLGRAGRDPHLAPGAPDELGVGAVAGRTCNPQLEPQEEGGLEPAVGHVVAVPHPGHGEVAARHPVLAQALGHREQVGEHLARMGSVGERVHHRDRGPAGHVLQLGVGEGPDHERVEVAGEHARRVANGLAAPELHVARGEHHLRRAELASRPPRTRPGCGWRPSRRPAPRRGRPAGAAPAFR